MARVRRKTTKVTKWQGVVFPEGSRAEAFKIWCKHGGDWNKTYEYMLDNKDVFNDRVPRIGLMKKWAKADNWSALKMLVDDGVLDVLSIEKDPRRPE